MVHDQKQLKHRNSSIEFLRILAMVMIVTCHFATHGGFSFDIQSLSIPRLWWSFIELGGNLGVNIFVLICGYFLVTNNGKTWDLKRILKFWGQVFGYSVAIYVVLCMIGAQDFEVVSCVKALFPITFNAWWFASTYFVLYLLHPFINTLLQKLDKKAYQGLIMMQLILWCVIPTFTASDYQSNHLLWFITLYCVAGYVRIFGLNPRFTAKSYFGFFVLFSALRYLSCVILMVLGIKFPSAADHSLFFYKQQSVLTFLSALSLFMVFEKWEIGYVKWINTVASATFGVYLIHDSDVVRSLLWQQMLPNAQYQNSVLLIPYSILVAATVYVVCTLIDLLRQRIIEKPFLALIDRYSKKWIKPLEMLVNAVKRFVFGKEN